MQVHNIGLLEKSCKNSKSIPINTSSSQTLATCIPFYTNYD